MEDLTSRDGLTGIPNRRRFDEFLENEWTIASKKSALLSMIMIDIDFFGNYNNIYGHLVGDDCLKQVAETLASSVERSGDFVARYGGEEFSAILPGMDSHNTYEIAEKMRKNIEFLEIPHEGSSVDEIVTISLGASTITPSVGLSFIALIEGSDSALFSAKRKGRNQVRFKDLNHLIDVNRKNE